MKYGVELRLPYIFHRVHRLCRSLSLSPKIPASRTLPPVAQTTVVVRTSAVAALCIVTRVITLPIASAVVRKPPKIAAVHLSHLTFIQVKAAYRKKVWESHPDLFPDQEKCYAECKFKLISEAYTCLQPGSRGEGSDAVSNTRVVRTGVASVRGGRRNHPLIGIPFIFIILGTVALGGLNASRAYKKQKEAYPSHNPFLP